MRVWILNIDGQSTANGFCTVNQAEIHSREITEQCSIYLHTILTLRARSGVI